MNGPTVYVPLPSDDELDALLARHGSQRAVANVIGCTQAAIAHRIRRRRYTGRRFDGDSRAGFRDWTPERRAAQSRATWAKLKTEGREGWSDERRAKYAATMAQKFPHTPKAKLTRAEFIGPEMAELRAAVEALTARVAELETQAAARLTVQPPSQSEPRPRPRAVQIVEWRPDHRRHADGGRPVRAQRRENGLAKRPKVVA